MADIYFCSFADSSLLPSLTRIQRQAQEMCVFAQGEIRIFTEKNLPHYAKKRAGKIIKETGTRKGYGYWSWKPAVIKQMFSKMKDDDILLYCDAGCYLNPNAKNKLLDYIKKTEENDILVTELDSEYNSYAWTKMDTIALFRDKVPEKSFEEGQLQGGTIFLKKSPYTDNIVEQWDRLMDLENLHYFDDSPSVLPNHPSFKENRHDQSILTLLLKSNHYCAEPVKNFTPESEQERERLWREEPILQLRDRQKAKSKTEKLLEFKERIRLGLRRRAKKILVFLGFFS